MNTAAQRMPSLLLMSILAGLFSLFMSLSAAAATLDSAKSEGWVGEMPTGYLGLVRQDAPADVKALVADVNGKRKERYEQIAKQQGVPLTEVEKVGGQTAIDKTSTGNYVMDSSGRWVKK